MIPTPILHHKFCQEKRDEKRNVRSNYTKIIGSGENRKVRGQREPIKT
jgi:hypothetical protein